MKISLLVFYIRCLNGNAYEKYSKVFSIAKVDMHFESNHLKKIVCTVLN